MRCEIYFTSMLALILASTPLLGSGSVLMIPNASDDTVALFDPFDGSLIDPNFIDADRLGLLTSVFMEAQRVGDEIWVTDSIDDAVFRFSLDGRESLGIITDLLLNNPEGFEVVGDTMLVGSRAGIISIDVPTKSYLGVFGYRGDDSSVNDVSMSDGMLLVSNSDTDDIDVIDTDGNYVSTLIDSDGVTGFNFPHQINTTIAGTLLVGSFADPAGMFPFDNAGNSTGPILAQGNKVRGLQQLGNGNYLFTNSDGVFLFDIVSDTVELVRPGRSSYITTLDAPPCLPDLTGDGLLNFFDIAEYVSLYSTGDSEADINFDDVLNFFDILAYITRFNSGCQ